MTDYGALALLYRENLGMFSLRFLQDRAGGRKIVWKPFHDLLCDRLMKVERGEIKRLIVNIQPRSLKSEICSVAFPAWILLRDPSAHIIGVSYEESLANALSRGTRDIMRSPMYQAIGGPKLSTSQFAADEFETTQGGRRLARSAGGAVTGRGGDLLIFDDLAPADHANNEAARIKLNERIETTLMSRGNSLKETRIIVVAQRLHEDDASGRFLREGGWEHFMLPSIAVEDEAYEYTTWTGPKVYRRTKGEVLMPELGSMADYDRLRRTMPAATFAAQFQQNPIPAEGNIVKLEWFPRYREVPDRFEQVIVSCDTASKAEEQHDYSAFVTFGRIGDRAWVLDVFRAKLPYPDLKREARERVKRFGAKVLVVEDTGSGIALIADLQREGMRVEPAGAKLHKELRLMAATSMMAEELISLPENAMWLEAFEHELRAFPQGRHDDMVDAFVHGIEWMKENPARSHLARFYEGEFNKTRRSPEAMVTVRSPGQDYRQVTLIDGTAKATDMEGFLTLTEHDALPLLMSGWTRVSE